MELFSLHGFSLIFPAGCQIGYIARYPITGSPAMDGL